MPEPKVLKSLRHLPEFNNLAANIRASSGHLPFDFYPSPGNWGDALINEGSVLHFRENGLPFRSLRRSDLPRMAESDRPPLAVIGGGGGWCKAWRSTPEFVAKASEVYGKVVLLPTTFDLSAGALDRPNVSYFSRDRSLPPKMAAYCPDMAFFLEYPQGVEASLGSPLISLRQDRERNRSAPIIRRNCDLSALGTASHEAFELVSLVSRFSVVYTDRLHIAIVAGMLGRDVNLLEGNYHKARGVYEATMSKALPNVTLLSWRDFRKDPAIREAQVTCRRQIVTGARSLASSVRVHFNR